MYCKYCGNEISVADNFCQKCGKANAETKDPYSYPKNAYGHQAHRRELHVEPKEKLYHELAYTGFCFWLPFLLEEKTSSTKKVANQGLWVLIVSVLACSTIQGLEYVNLLLNGSFLFIISNIFYSFAFIVFLGFMMYLLYKCIMNVKAIHNGQEVRDMLFFDKVRFFR